MQILADLARRYKGYRYKSRSRRADPARLISGQPAARLLGLEAALSEARGRTVLDVGCHDGSVAEAFAKAGALRVDGCDISSRGVQVANERVPRIQPSSSFYVSDLSKGPAALEVLPLLPKYDIVCYLGMHHHLVNQMSPADLRQLTAAILDRCSDIFVARTPLVRFDELHQMIIGNGFTPLGELEITGKAGPSRAYRKAA